MSTDTPFDFTACQGDVATCKGVIAGLLPRGPDWAEVHCGRCGAKGIVRHAEILPAAPVYQMVPVDPEAAPPAPASEAEVSEPTSAPESQPVASPGPSRKGSAPSAASGDQS